jgi:hypothetical protein
MKRRERKRDRVGHKGDWVRVREEESYELQREIEKQ